VFCENSIAFRPNLSGEFGIQVFKCRGPEQKYRPKFGAAVLLIVTLLGEQKNNKAAVTIYVGLARALQSVPLEERPASMATVSMLRTDV
jgi:hypothetical protein